MCAHLCQGFQPQPKVNRDSNPDSRLMDVCWIVPKMLWIHYLVGVSHFAKCHANRPVAMRNADKSPKTPYSA